MARDFKTIGVVGLGTMGAGIAEVFARNGYAVIGVEQDDEGAGRGRRHLESSTARAVGRGKMTEAEQETLRERITITTYLADLTYAYCVVKAVLRVGMTQVVLPFMPLVMT